MLKDNAKLLATHIAVIFGLVGSIFLPLFIAYSTPLFYPLNVSVFLLPTLIALISLSWLQIKNIYSNNLTRVRNARISLLILLIITWSLSAHELWRISNVIV
jgi:hypothetical protein